MWKEFKAFIARGNVLDMAVGIIIGAAFGKIVSSLVNDIIMPPIGFVLAKVDFSGLVITLHHKTATSPAVVISYGAFINTIINFLIIGFVIFIVVKQVNRIMPEKSKEIVSKDCPYCCSSIAVKAVRCPQCTAMLT